MLPHNSIDFGKVYREKVEPMLTRNEAKAMEKAAGASRFKTLYAEAAGKVHWYILNAPPALRGRHFGVAESRQEAENAVSKALGTKKVVFA